MSFAGDSDTKRRMGGMSQDRGKIIRVDIDSEGNRPLEMTSNGFEPDQDNGTKMYDVFQLHEHIEKECPKTRTCSDCEHEFKTVEQFHMHLRYHCNSVKIQCSQCNETMTRQEFRFHKCYTDLTLSAIDQLRRKELQQIKDQKVNNSETEKALQEQKEENIVLKD